MNAFLSKFMMYYEIKRMNRDGRLISKISDALNCSRRTVKKYLEMEDQEFEAFVNVQSNREKLLEPYESFVQQRLELYHDTPAAQMHDWLKEHHQDFPPLTKRLTLTLLIECGTSIIFLTNLQFGTIWLYKGRRYGTIWCFYLINQ